MSEVVFLLEEGSMEVLLDAILPRIAPGSAYSDEADSHSDLMAIVIPG